MAIAFVGIGENGHVAFNDPPADFQTEEPYLAVELDEACRQQQVNEGWFAKPEEVPSRAISICLEGEISPLAPASILREHPNTTIYLDRDSASLLGWSAMKR